MGEITKSDRFRILKRDGFKCVYCGRSAGDDGAVLHIDHKIPKCEGGSGRIDNLVTACADCNHGKGPHPGRHSKNPTRGKQDRSPDLAGYFFHSRAGGKITGQGYVLAVLAGERCLVRLLSWVDGLPIEERIATWEEMQRWSFYSTARQMRSAWAEESRMPVHKLLLMEQAIEMDIKERCDAQA